MSQLKNDLQEIYQEKVQKIIPENIKKDIQIFDVVGTYGGSGVDTSDANAIASDIAMDKTAYVNGQKITGTLGALSFISFDSNITAELSASFNSIRIQCNDIGIYNLPVILPKNAAIALDIDYSALATVIGLTADKIKFGETILGITGTYTGEATQSGEEA